LAQKNRKAEKRGGRRKVRQVVGWLLRAVIAGSVGLGRLGVGGSYGAAMDRIEDFAPMNGDFLGGLDPQADFVASDLHNDDRNVIVDDDTFVLFAR
jgi:hypothetical protein